jgi:hypothetical protein
MKSASHNLNVRLAMEPMRWLVGPVGVRFQVQAAAARRPAAAGQARARPVRPIAGRDHRDRVTEDA